MIRLSWMTRSWLIVFVLSAAVSVTCSTASAAQSKKSAKRVAPVDSVAQRYAEAISKGDKVEVAKLDFACQFRLVAATKSGMTSYPDSSDASYDACWNQIKRAHEPALTRVDVGMDVLWPSNGALAFFREDLHRYPASAFVMDEVGLSPPGSGLHVTTIASKSLPKASFRLREQERIVSVPTTLVTTTVTYQDSITAPVTKAPGSYKWTSSIKPARRVLKSIKLQWVVLSGLKKHGFPGDAAVVNLLVEDGAPVDGIAQEIVPFVTKFSKAVPESLVWFRPHDVPGLLVANAARAATFPNLRDRIALLNRVLIIDPDQPDALTVLTRDLYAVILRDSIPAHNLAVKDPALAMVVNEHYWNVYAQSARMDLSLGMEMGGFDKPTTADSLYRLLPALRTLAKVRPEQLDNRFRWGAALRWNNDQELSLEVLEQLVKDIPAERKAGKAEALLQLAWSRVNKVAWNRNFHDPDVLAAYETADEALKYADLPLDKFLAEYTKAYSLLFAPKRDNRAILERLTEAKRWFAEVPGQTPEVWNFFMGSESMKVVLDADPIFQPLLAAANQQKG